METVSESLLEATKQIVEQEILDAKGKKYDEKASYETAVKRYLNNFDLNLQRMHPYAGNYRFSANDRWKIKYGDFMKQQKEKYKKEGWGEYSDAGVSELKKSKTPKEFFEDIDKAAIAEGFDLDKLDKEIQSTENGFSLQVKILPIYIRLRAMGYNQDDLTT